MTTLLFLSLLLIFVTATPDLLTLSSRNECIKSIVTDFISHSTCEKLSQQTKSSLALKMTNCLFQHMGKQQVQCTSPNQCDLQGDSWNTFTTFFTHIDNLCHFYWDISKAERTDQMIEALLTSASTTAKSLQKNQENTNQILELQTNLRLQILTSMATQEQMNQIISNSSITINKLTSQISVSLNEIHADIHQNYAVVTRILSAINQVLKHLDSLHEYLVAEVNSLQGVLFFLSLMFAVLVGCFLSQKVRLRKNQCFILISLHFLMEFFFASAINSTLGVQPMRCVSIFILFMLILTAKPERNQMERMFSSRLNSQRMKRIMSKALRSHLKGLKALEQQSSGSTRSTKKTPAHVPGRVDR